MSKHCGVVLLILFIPCYPCIVFTFHWSSFKVSAQRFPMEPSASDLGKILRRHEVFGQANNTALQQLMAKLREFEEMMAGLSHQMEEKFGEFKAAHSALARRMDEMEAAFHQFRAPGPLQRSASDSVNPGRPFLPDAAAENDSGNSDRGTAPMDIEDGPLQLSGASDNQDSASNM
jgi:hypothetical protein